MVNNECDFEKKDGDDEVVDGRKEQLGANGRTKKSAKKIVRTVRSMALANRLLP